MQIQSAHIVAYSPTGTTLKNLSEVAAGMGCATIETSDLTRTKNSGRDIRIAKESVAIIGVPVYAGRVAPAAMARLSHIKGENTPAVVIAVYGNRHYENALQELYDTVEKAGFTIIGAAALLGEHSFSTETMPIATGRPDPEDIAEARLFGDQIRKKIAASPSIAALTPPAIPGTLPDTPFTPISGIAPKVETSLCKGCGICMTVCPVGAIGFQEHHPLCDPASCTLCCACIKACPEGALSMTAPRILEITDFLFKNCQERRKPEFFL